MKNTLLESAIAILILSCALWVTVETARNVLDAFTVPCVETEDIFADLR
jgi:hypothetical protein